MTDQPRIHLFGQTPQQLIEWCAQRDLPRYRALQLLEWAYRHAARSLDEMTNLPKTLRHTLAAEVVLYTATIAQQRQAPDKTQKLLLRWPDGETTECVLIPDDERRTACVSTQVGCPVGCTFCASGIDGLVRQLTAGEIVEQVMHLRALCSDDAPLTNIVFMGSGEPLANYDATVSAIHILTAEHGLHLGARRITLSTVGLPKQIRRLADEDLKINLAISLHAVADERRRELIPWAREIHIDDLVDAARYYFDRTGREITFEYIMLSRLNMRSIDVDRLARIARIVRSNLNLIPYNPVQGLPFERPEPHAVRDFVAALRDRGVNAHVRHSRGLEVDAACGQLRRRVQATQHSGVEVNI